MENQQPFAMLKLHFLMKYIVQISLFIYCFICFSCSDNTNSNQVLVEGGELKSLDSLTASKKLMITDFYIGKYEVTQKEWNNVMGVNSSELVGDNFPVTNVSWYDCITYCNKKSESEGLKPYYNINKILADTNILDTKDTIKWTVTPIETANGYRLPTIYEWEYAASGGKLSKQFKYSGSNDLNEVGWYFANSGRQMLGGIWSYKAVSENDCKPHEVGIKTPNELGLFDMSGNVREWCWDYKNIDITDVGRALKGGGWLGGDYICEPALTRHHSANLPSRDLGFRAVRNK
jgi:formylglycine-generating enzyme